MDTLTVGILAGKVAATLNASFPAPLWVKGEVQSKRTNKSGHVYLELIERPEPNALPNAVVKVVAYKDDLANIWRVLKENNITIEDGSEVRILLKPQFFKKQGTLQFSMLDIDAKYTLGKLVHTKDSILKALVKDNLLDKNKHLYFSPLPLKIALITSVNSAAYHDFKNELESSYLAWQILAINSTVQGVQATSRIIKALTYANKLFLNSTWKPDVVVIIRGGGSKTDLASFDDEELARTIALSKIPVFTGIGHEIDRSIADEVAYSAFKTPTACAQGLIQYISNALLLLEAIETKLDTRLKSITEHAQAQLSFLEERLGTSYENLLDLSEKKLQHIKYTLDRGAVHYFDAAEFNLNTLKTKIITTFDKAVKEAEHQLDMCLLKLTSADPQTALQRGFSLTRDSAGNILKSLPLKDDIVSTQISLGVFKSVVKEE